MAMVLKMLLWAIVLIVPGGIVALPLLVRAYGGRERGPKLPLPSPARLLGAPDETAPVSAHAA
jgi:hypothetical protein